MLQEVGGRRAVRQLARPVRYLAIFPGGEGSKRNRQIQPGSMPPEQEPGLLMLHAPINGEGGRLELTRKAAGLVESNNKPGGRKAS